MGELNFDPFASCEPYKPVALYYHDADSVEYVRRDVPTVSRRIDDFLTLILDMKNRDQVIGFRLKGFQNFYINHLKKSRGELDDEFFALAAVLESALTTLGNNYFDKVEQRTEAYKAARRIAIEDKVILEEKIAA